MPDDAGAPCVLLIADPGDEAWLLRLERQLNVLAQPGGFEVRTLAQIPPGELTSTWLDGVAEQLSEVVVLVSAELLTASPEEAHRRALQRALEVRESRPMTLVPLLTKPCTWRAVGWLAGAQVRPRHGRALSQLARREVDEVLSELAAEISARVRMEPRSAHAPAEAAPPAPRAAGAWTRLRREALAVSLSAVAAVGAHSLRLLEGFETPALDEWLSLAAPPDTADVAVVAIDDAAYRDRFSARSPLDPERLFALISAVSRARPAVIGVALDTSAETFARWRPAPDWPVVVWAQGAHEAAPGRGLEPAPVLGRPAHNHALSAGLALVRPERDGLVRSYERLHGTADGGVLPSFAAQLAAQLCLADAQRCPRWRAPTTVGEEAPLRWTAAPAVPAVSAAELEAAGEWSSANPLAGRAVIIGGTYAAANDVHDTPVGPQAGVMVQAQALAAELAAPTAPAWPRARLWASAAVLALLLAAMGWAPGAAERAWRVGAGVGLVLIASVAAGGAARWPSFALIPLGLTVQRWRDARRTASARRARKRLKGERT